MASTITRDTLTDDSGSASSPDGDGTVLNNDVLQDNIYARVDEMFSGAGSYSTLALGGFLSSAGIRDGSSTTYLLQTDLGSIADSAVVNLSAITADPEAFCFLLVTGSGGWHLPGLIYLRGTEHGTYEIADPASGFSVTKDTGSMINVYWSAGNNRYELQNKSGVTITVRRFLLISA